MILYFKMSIFVNSLIIIEDVDYIVPLNKLNLFLGEHGIPLVKKTVNATYVDFKLKDIDYITEIKELYKADYDLVPNY